MLQHRLGNFHLPAAAYGPSTETPANQPQASGAARHQGRLYYDPTGSLGNADNSQAAGASQALVSPRDFAKSPHFAAFKQEYHGLVDNLGSYLLKHHGSASAWHQEQEAKLKGPGQRSIISLSTEQLMAQASARFHQMSRSGERVPDWINSLHTLHEFKQRLFDFNESGQNPHYPTDDELALAYGSLKQELEGLETLLGSDHYHADAKVQSALEVGIASGKCAAGLEEEAQQQKSTLRASVAGLPLKVATTRDQMALQLLESVAGEFGAYEGDIRHVAVALYNHLKPEFGLGELAGSGNWSTTLDRLGQDEQGLHQVIDYSRQLLNQQLSATGVLSHVATEGLQSLRDMLTGLPALKGKEQASLDEMDMFAITKELNNSKEFKALSESYGAADGLPVQLAFARQPDETFRLTQNPVKFELYLMKQMHQQGMGVETEPHQILSRTHKDQDGNAIQTTFGHWDDLAFVTENDADARPLPLEQQDHELLSAHHLQQISPDDLAQKHRPQFGRNNAFARPPSLTAKDKELCQAMMTQVVQNSDSPSLAALPIKWFNHLTPEHMGPMGARLLDVPEGKPRMDAANNLLLRLNHNMKNLFVEGPALLNVLRQCRAQDLLDPAAPEGLHPLIKSSLLEIEPQAVIHLFSAPQDFPQGPQGLRLLRTLNNLMNLDQGKFDALAQAATEHAVQGMSPEEMLNQDMKDMLRLPMAPLFAKATELAPAAQLPWLTQMVASFASNSSAKLEDALDAALAQIPGQSDKMNFAFKALDQAGASRQTIAKTAVKHQLNGLLAQSLGLPSGLRPDVMNQQIKQAALQFSTTMKNTLMHFAASYDNRSLLQLLADTPLLSKLNDDNESPINSAIEAGNKGAILFLAKRMGAELNNENPDGFTVTPWIEDSAIPMPDFSTEDNIGVTPLGQAMLRGGMDDVLPEMIRSGANIYNGLPSAFEIALHKGDPDTLQSIMTPPSLEASLMEMLSIRTGPNTDRGRMAEVLLQQGAQLNLYDDEVGLPLILRAYKEGDQAVFNTMVRFADSATANHQDPDGESTLMVAVRMNDLPLAQWLMRIGGDVNLRNHEGQSMLDLAQSDDMRQLLSGGGTGAGAH
ncbi:hypothetical protein ACKC9G_09845 [Pokkaliibacter sp. CJK22405]|uniref:hypothetical protein n=1 Tax=Pokkaliibacter sp. CJK22405 TaxID=3384615 RepID=UPI003985069B